MALALALVTATAPGPALVEKPFHLSRTGETAATIVGRCSPCAWDMSGREGAVVVVSIDKRYSQHIVLFRGEEPAQYRVSLGRLDAGDHSIRIVPDADWTPRGVEATISDVRIDMAESSHEQVALAHSPIIHARPDTVGRFTDVPLVSWYEVNKLDASTRFRYGIIFSNEDGGTPTDRLMATWGRTTDIEYVYWVEVTDTGEIRSAGFEGPGHLLRSFAGQREDRHPLLWVATLNNLIEETGRTSVRFRPAPFRFDLTHASREAVMDAHPWTYGVSAREVAREGKIKPTAIPGSGGIVDPRRFAYVEACGEITNSAVAVAVGVSGSDGTTWFRSDADRPDFRIARSGCFRAAIPLPSTIEARQITQVRLTAFSRSTQPEAASPRARITQINKLFMLSDLYVPEPNLLTWEGDVVLTADQPSWTESLPRR